MITFVLLVQLIRCNMVDFVIFFGLVTFVSHMSESMNVGCVCLIHTRCFLPNSSSIIVLSKKELMLFSRIKFVLC